MPQRIKVFSNVRIATCPIIFDMMMDKNHGVKFRWHGKPTPTQEAMAIHYAISELLPMTPPPSEVAVMC